MYHIRKAVKADAELIQHLGTEVYHSTYTAILSGAQIDFMLRKNYSPEAIRQIMAQGQDFYLVSLTEGPPVGFIALQQKDSYVLRIEKLYLLANIQGQGLGKILLEFAERQARDRGFRTIELNVNRSNSAYHFYLKQGFHVIEEVDIPYHGYVLEDYVMQKSVH